VFRFHNSKYIYRLYNPKIHSKIYNLKYIFILLNLKYVFNYLIQNTFLYYECVNQFASEKQKDFWVGILKYIMLNIQKRCILFIIVLSDFKLIITNKTRLTKIGRKKRIHKRWLIS